MKILRICAIVVWAEKSSYEFWVRPQYNTTIRQQQETHTD
jgi:hypothetical protein